MQPGDLLGPLYDRVSGLADADQMQSIDLCYWLPGDILKKADRMGMAHSLEIRVPFLDLEVYETARRLPHDMKFRHGHTKYALRRAAAEVLPEKVSARKKRGFPVPIRRWLREDDWYLQVREAFAGKTAAHYFHRDYLLALLEAHRSGKEDHSRKIWTVYSFLLWHRIYFEGEASGWKRSESLS